MSFETRLYKPSTLAILAVAGTALMTTPAFSHEKHDRSDDVKETHQVTNFDKIEIVGVYELDVEVGPDFSVRTSGAAKEVEDLKVFVRGDTLVLDNNKKKTRKIKNKHAILATITLPSLEGVEIVGVGTGEMKGINSETFDLEVSGVGEIDFAGVCGSLRAEVSGVGSFSTEDLKCEDVKAEISGVGEFTVYASESADVSAMGIGQVEVVGNPKSLKKDSSFLSKIRVRD